MYYTNLRSLLRLPLDPLKIRIVPLAILAAGLIFQSSAAQEAELKPLEPRVHSKAETASSPSDFEIIHVTDILARMPEAQEGLEKFIEARDAGALAARKGGLSFDLGEEKSFNVLEGVQADEPSWVSKTFVLRSTNDVANVWIEQSLDSTVSDEQFEELDEHILHSTPASSFRPDRGIVENDNYLFGDPPNVDGDGKVDILTYDIEEGEGESCCILGYVTSADLNPDPVNNQGNAADILHVDVKEGLSQGVTLLAWIIAHEYQHLIHYNYQQPIGSEFTFINEGLSEWASVINGYFNRGTGYLNITDEHRTPLLEWDTSENVYDYERSGLFTTYIADRIGPEATGSIVRAEKDGFFANGADGYEVVLQEHGTSLTEVIAGFHTANFVNDAGIDPQYGYNLVQRMGVKAVPTIQIDGTSSSSYNRDSVVVASGSVRYYSWSDVGDFTVTADIIPEVADAIAEIQRERVQLRVVLEHLDGQQSVEAIQMGADSHTFEGDFSRLTLIIANTSTGASSSSKIDVAATWDESGGSGVAREAIVFDDGTATGQFFAMSEVARLANKFEAPPGSRLATVHVAPVYDNDFSNSDVPAGTAKDFRLHVWSVDADGFPDAELFSTDVTENPATQHINFASGEFSFLEIELPDTSVLSELGDSVFVGLSNIGPDNNYLALAPSAKESGDDVSYLYLDFINGEGWAPLAEITDGGEEIFEDTVHPIRVEFLVSTALDSDDEAELPAQISLAQNYPNPFNPSTSIEYSLPSTMHVRLAVYDALGRHIATVVDGVRTAGEHEAQLDAGEWASGVYFYMLETDARTVSKRMILMK